MKQEENMDINLLDLITEQEKHTIDTLRKKSMSENHDSRNFVSTDDWLFSWHEAKKSYLSNIFGDGLILTKDITYNKSTEQLVDDIDNMFFSRWNTKLSSDDYNTVSQFFTAFETKLREVFDVQHPMPYESTHYKDYNKAMTLLDSYSLATNKYERDNVVFTTEKETYILRNGAKVSKAIGHLVKMYNINCNWERVRILLSQILNDRHLEGTLCLSIHPADYLTASINTYGWGSCMDFYEGDYRNGVIEMMNSPMVIVGYLTGKDVLSIDYNNKDIWNSKKWREFFIVTPDVISGIKGYPYNQTDLEERCLNWLKELVINNYPEWGNWSELTDYKHNMERSEKAGAGPYVAFTCGPNMYCDFNNNPYRLYWNIDNNTIASHIHIEYSGIPICVICGNENYSNDTAKTTCDDCEEYLYCYNCGERIYNGDSYIEINGHIYCDDCADNIAICDSCDGYKENLDIALDSNILIVTPEAMQKDTISYEDSLVSGSITICKDCISKYVDNVDKFYNEDIVYKKQATPWYICSVPCISYEAFNEAGKKFLINAGVCIPDKNENDSDK